MTHDVEGAPRWVKVSAVVALVLVVVVVVVLVTGRGDHGPSRHTPSGDGGGHRPPGGHPQP